MAAVELDAGVPRGASAAKPLRDCQTFCTISRQQQHAKNAQFRVAQCSKAAASYSEGSPIASI